MSDAMGAALTVSAFLKAKFRFADKGYDADFFSVSNREARRRNNQRRELL